MAKIVLRDDDSPPEGDIDPSQWTVMVIAAGRGTRLGFDKPKILFPVGGITILARLIQLFSPFCSNFLFVLSPEGSPVVQPEIEALLGSRARIAIQHSPLGMGDAVFSGLAQIRTPKVAIVWGDQVALKSSSLEFCMRLMDGREPPAAVCPTLIRQHPYIHFERDGDGTLVKVLQHREGDKLPGHGESDAGVFFFQTSALLDGLTMLMESGEAKGKATGEINFLPVFPLIDRAGWKLITARIMSEVESVGINSAADAEYLQGRLDITETEAESPV